MNNLSSINSEHRPHQKYSNTVPDNKDIRQFGVTGLMANMSSCTKMRDIANSRNLAAGETLFWEDDPNQYAYFLIDGSMKAYKLLPNGRSQIIRFITSSEIITSTMMTSHAYSTEALTDCTILQLPQNSLDRIMANDPVLTKSIFNKLAVELQHAQKQILLLGRMPAIERVSNFLLDIAQRQNPNSSEIESELSIKLPMARADIADYLGLTIETVSRAFSKFRRDGLIDLPRPNLVHLRNQTRLMEHSIAHVD